MERCRKDVLDDIRQLDRSPPPGPAALNFAQCQPAYTANHPSKSSAYYCSRYRMPKSPPSPCLSNGFVCLDSDAHLGHSRSSCEITFIQFNQTFTELQVLPQRASSKAGKLDMTSPSERSVSLAQPLSNENLFDSLQPQNEDCHGYVVSELAPGA